MSKDIREIDAEIEKNEKELLSMIDDFQVTDETRDIIQAMKEVFQ
ncbi:hypothetical protein [Ruoffia tabacinasalis]|nr:hypothetical protein [Ruoffia tabacinasalis]